MFPLHALVFGVVFDGLCMLCLIALSDDGDLLLLFLLHALVFGVVAVAVCLLLCVLGISSIVANRFYCFFVLSASLNAPTICNIFWRSYTLQEEEDDVTYLSNIEVANANQYILRALNFHHSIS